MLVQSEVVKSALRSAASFSSKRGEKAKLLVLAYHRVLSEDDELTGGNVTRQDFEWQMSVVKEQFNVLPLEEAAQRLEKNSLPSRAICVTFDDGYRDNYTSALPILREKNIPATIFVAPGFLDGGIMWNDKIIESIRRFKGERLSLQCLDLYDVDISDSSKKKKCMYAVLDLLKYLAYEDRIQKVEAIVEEINEPLPTNMMLDSSQVMGLHSDGITIGAHTMTHPILSKISIEAARHEIECSANFLRELLDSKVASFAFPNGRPHVDYKKEHVEAVQSLGFKVAVSTAWGHADRTSDVFQLPRVGSWDKSALRFNLRLLKCYLREKGDQIDR